MTTLPFIGGLPVIELRAAETEAPARLTRALIAPGRAMMLLQLWAHLPGLGETPLISCPDLDEAVARLNKPGDLNVAFAFGGAVLAPFANRIRGVLDGDQIRAQIGEGEAVLPANGGGKSGVEPYAIHGLILDKPVRSLDADKDQAHGKVYLGEGGAWPSVFDIAITWRLSADELTLSVTARNTGESPAPIGLGWHPYFRLPSGERATARLHVPSTERALVDNYESVLPTGQVETVIGGAYDFSAPGGRALGELFLDDCFLEPTRDEADRVCISIEDPGAELIIKVASKSPNIKGIQVYAPPQKAFVVVEPQFNLANPFGSEWGGRDTGMVSVAAGEEVSYDAGVQIMHSKAQL